MYWSIVQPTYGQCCMFLATTIYARISLPQEDIATLSKPIIETLAHRGFYHHDLSQKVSFGSSESEHAGESLGRLPLQLVVALVLACSCHIREAPKGCFQYRAGISRIYLDAPQRTQNTGPYQKFKGLNGTIVGTLEVQADVDSEDSTGSVVGRCTANATEASSNVVV